MAYIVLGQKQDQHAQYMLEKLKMRGLDAYLLSTHDFPRNVQFSYCPTEEDGSLTLNDGQILKLSEIKAVFWRGFSGVSDESTRENYLSFDSIAAQDSLACLRTWFLLDNGTVWMNSWQAFQHHKEKPLQLTKVKRLGVNIPKTYIGNNLEDVKAAYDQLEQSIFKPVFGGAHTEMLTDEHLSSERLADALAKSPITVQKFIAGTNIRTYVVGDKTISIELKSEKADFREDENTVLTVIETPKQIAEQAKAIKSELFLNWTAIDWRRDEQGNYYFLEANPSPMFIGFERQSGVPLTEYIIDEMCK
ncbi:hypothetical protein CWB73_20190 [Pseudoalteromonas phenolica]|uniref:ATP-grasp domain-containing protein n=1 Tax=Pseudoalteromonas phenolica TaxID=161398 RepID=A0A5S3YP55_9GAMM|nr:hypothetical protein [Pseudoalteromonas phenolica]TMP77376.1 hypothetical protein CWB73_20190 [Pseudoalteromonas phenolica]